MSLGRRRSGSGLFITRGSRVPDGVRQRAREMRKNPTAAEALLWEELRRSQLDGLRFRRQQPIGGFIADFYCDALRLVVEVDGPIHDQAAEYDRERDDLFRARGLQVVRFTNDDVLKSLPAVVERILSFRTDTVPNGPSPLGEGPGEG